MKTPVLALAGILLVFHLAGSNAHAQAMTVIGGSAMARDCFMSAKLASTLTLMSRSSLEACDYALEHGDMSLRDRAATYVNRGIIKAALEDYKEAIADYEIAIKMKPEFAETYINRGNVFYMGHAYGRAIEDYSKAVELNLNKLHIAHLNRGMAYERIGDRANAESDYRRALELYPDWSLAREKLDRLLAKSSS
jgi:tetratricopeptide (TPR) repeat protein